MRPSTPTHDPIGHDDTEQHQRCLRHTRRAGRPKHGRSTSSTSGRSFNHASLPHAGHSGRKLRCSTCNTIGAPASSTTPNTFTSGKPTSNSHTPIGFVSTGVLQSDSFATVRLSGPLSTTANPYTPLIREEPVICRVWMAEEGIRGDDSIAVDVRNESAELPWQA